MECQECDPKQEPAVSKQPPETKHRERTPKKVFFFSFCVSSDGRINPAIHCQRTMSAEIKARRRPSFCPSSLGAKITRLAPAGTSSSAVEWKGSSLGVIGSWLQKLIEAIFEREREEGALLFQEEFVLFQDHFYVFTKHKTKRK